MANIMLNKICNLKCPYCFANEFVNNLGEVGKIDPSKSITFENFKKAMQFIVNSGESFVGLIGGEPTLHPQFKEMVEYAISLPQINKVNIFSNGIYLDRYMNLLSHPKVTTLINLNPPSDMGQKKFDLVVKNIETAINQYYLKDKISLGINMYKPDFEYMYMVNTLRKFGYSHLRTAIAVPNNIEKREFNAIEYFMDMKPQVFKFFEELLKANIMPTYDCNLMPVCVTTQEEKLWLQKFWALEDKSHSRCNITDNPVCHPVVDILTDLTAVRCFGVSDALKVNITDFACLSDVSNYFDNKLDSMVYLIPTTKSCVDCYYRKAKSCSGGCIAFKIKQIQQMTALVEENCKK